jgi:hypothetical protein
MPRRPLRIERLPKTLGRMLCREGVKCIGVVTGWDWN